VTRTIPTNEDPLLPASAARFAYRREIDGLRAVAVLAVILFHAGFAPFGGGFVGVDVFFVISGYLITCVLVSELSAGTFTLAGFYERRARRILPALFAMLLVCVPLAWAWLLPADMKAFGQALLAVCLFVSNLFFHRGNDYFAADAELNPLLHTWSLSVEEQYYLAYPVLLALLWRAGGRRLLTPVFAATAVLSLAWAQWTIGRDASAAFYLLPARAWELLVGALVATCQDRAGAAPAPRWRAEIGAAAGLALIVAAVLAFDRHTPVPGVHALIPTLGAVLVLMYADARTAVGRLLGARLPVALGLISYSAYLWHQPLFAFTRHTSVEPPDALLMTAVALLTLAVAWISWEYVETPFRQRRFPARKAVFALAGTASAAFIAVAVVVDRSEGFPGRVTGSQRDVVAYATYAYQEVYRQGTCLLEVDADPSGLPACAAGTGAVAVWGDSHAAALSFGLRDLAPHLTQFTASGCPPLKDIAQPVRPRCMETNAFILQALQRAAPAKVLLHANWTLYPRQDVLAGIAHSVDALRTVLPGVEVVVVGSVPHWRPSLPAYLASRQLGLDSEYSLDNTSLGELRALDAALQDAARTHGATFVSALDLMCQGDRCAATTRYRGKVMPVAWDYGHLTSGGSVFLAGKLLAHRSVGGM
jgi:peptidoglycan/LPS O-acetylase OafA/YrhL